MSEPTCGHTVVDNEGIEQPCDRPATGWRWYQDVEHEDCLEPACDWHANEGGRRMRAAEAKVDRVEALTASLQALQGEAWMRFMSATGRSESLWQGRFEGYQRARSDLLDAIADAHDYEPKPMTLAARSRKGASA